MRKRDIFLFLIILFLTVDIASAIGVNECTTLYISGNYVVTTNLETSSMVCITIDNHSITLDCNNRNIKTTGDADAGIRVNDKDNITIKNCNVITTGSGSAGIHVLSGNNVTLQNNRINTSNVGSSGILLESTPRNNIINIITNNTITTTGNGSFGMYLYLSSKNDLTSNSINTAGSQADGIYSYNSFNNNWASNTVNTNGSEAYGIYVYNSSNNSWISNTINTNGSQAYGIYIYNSSNNYLTNNSMNSLNAMSLFVDGTSKENYDHSITTSNLVWNKTVYYYYNREDIPTILLNTSGHAEFAYCKNVVLNYCTISNDGVILRNTNNSEIKYSTINTTPPSVPGIYLYSSSNNTIRRNDITTNGSEGSGIYLWLGSDNTLLRNNIITAGADAYGIKLRASSGNTVMNNTVNTTGEYAYGVLLYISSNNTLTNNTVDTSGYYGYGIYLSSSSRYNNLTNNTVSTYNQYANGIELYSNANNNTLIGNIINATDYGSSGIELYSSSGNNLAYNDVKFAASTGIYLYLSNSNQLLSGNSNQNGYDGIYLRNSNDNLIENYTVTNNGFNGIELVTSSNNTLRRNNITTNSNIGIYSENSNNATIYLNIVCNNTIFDFNSPNWYGSSGANNTCNRSDDWNDYEYLGCTYNCAPTRVISVIDKSRLYELYNADDTNALMSALQNYSQRVTGVMYNLTTCRDAFDAKPGLDSAFSYRNKPDNAHWDHYPEFVKRCIERIIKQQADHFSIPQKNMSLLLVGNDNVTPYHRMSALLENWEDDKYDYIPGNMLWSDFPYSDINNDDVADIPVTRLETDSPVYMRRQLENAQTRYVGTKTLLAIKWGTEVTRNNHAALLNALINGWGFDVNNVFYYDETRAPTVAIVDKKINDISYLDRLDDDNVLLYADAHGNDFRDPGENVQRLSDDTNKVFLYPNNVTLGASHPLFITKACHGACTYPGDNTTTSLVTALLANGAVGFVGWRAYGPTVAGADFYSNFYFPQLRAKSAVGRGLMEAKNRYVAAMGVSRMSRFILRACHHYGTPDYIVHVPNDPVIQGYNTSINSSGNMTTISIEVSSYNQSTVETDEENRTLFTIPGAYTWGSEGDYVVPEILENITVPSTLDLGNVSAVVTANTEIINNVSLPVVRWAKETDNVSAYSGTQLNLTGLYPTAVVSYETVKSVDGFRTLYFRIFPFQFNDSANVVYIYRNISFSFGTVTAAPEPLVQLSATAEYNNNVSGQSSYTNSLFIDNDGASNAVNISITEFLPTNFVVDYISDSGTRNSSTGVITWSVGSIPPTDYVMPYYQTTAPQINATYRINTTIQYTDVNGTTYSPIYIQKNITVTESGEITNYISLQQGWNLMSLPLIV